MEVLTMVALCLMSMASSSFMGSSVIESSLAIERQHVVLDVVMLNAVLGLSFDFMEEFVVLMLDIVHQLGALVVVDIMLVSVTTVVSVVWGVMTEVLVRLVMVIVMVAAVVGIAFVTLVRVVVRLVSVVVIAALVMDGGMVAILVLLVDVMTIVLWVKLLVVSLRMDVVV